jgi:uncharacterized protein YlxP (DUF503 family)
VSRFVGAPSTHVGVLAMRVQVDGATTLKERRAVLQALRDRVRDRFAVTWNEVDDQDLPSSRRIVVTTAGSDARDVRSTLDRVRAFVEGSGRAWPIAVDVDVFGWQPRGFGGLGSVVAEGDHE